MDELDKEINECKVLEAELATLKKGKSVYIQYGSGLVLYRDDPGKIRRKNQVKLKNLETKHRELKDNIS